MDPRLGLAVLVGVCLVQLPAVFVLARRVELVEELPWRPGYAMARPTEQPATPGVCHACGTANAPAFAYCQQCLGRL